MALLLSIVVLLFLLVAFVYQIITTQVTAVDAPTLLKSAAAPAPPAAALPYRQPQPSAFPARGGGQHGRIGDAAVPPAGPAPLTSPREASGRLRSEGGAVRGGAALAIGGLVAGILGGWLLYHPARGATACSHQVIEVCSQGFVVLTGSQIAGGAIALAGILAVVIAGVLAAR
jgi:hypothetical protein